MCGIAGYISKTQPVSEALLKSMAKSLYHRGPDHQGYFFKDGVGLVSTRLSIIDLVPESNMPMFDQDKKRVIVYNGEVYNFSEIRQQLIGRGRPFRTKSDTEVVLHAFTEYGPDCFRMFNGMFGVCIYDQQKRQLTLARDRFGKKNVYYYFNGSEFIFSSEIKTIWALKKRDLTLNHRAVYEYLATEYVEHSLFTEIRCLEPGTVLTFDLQTFTIQQIRSFFELSELIDPDLAAELRRKKTIELVELVRTRLERAIQYRCMSDAPLATLCSGGLDSSLVTILAQKQVPRIEAYIVDVTDDPERSELRFARQVADRYTIKLRHYGITKEVFKRDLPHAIYNNDIPLAHENSVPIYFVSRLAKEDGIKVLLTGEGADETFGGYAWRYRSYTLPRIKQSIGRVLKRFEHVISRGDRLFYGNCFNRISPENFALLASNNLRREAGFRRIKNQFTGMPPKDAALCAMMVSDLNMYISAILHRQDRASMRASIESRLPFLDIELVKLAVNLPLRCKVTPDQDKVILKQLMGRFMDKAFIHRRKMGFGLPLENYLRDIDRRKIFDGGFVIGFFGEEILSIETTNPSHLFKLMNLEIWHRIFIRHEPVEEIYERYLV